MIDKSEILNSKNIIRGKTALVGYSKKMSREMTFAEKLIWFNVLSKKQLAGYKFVKQKIVFSYILDFYCSELLCAIEVDGSSHDQKIEYDRKRDLFLKTQGITTIRISNVDVLNNLEGVRTFLLNLINDISNALKEK
jgi:very-short-patch-repair endonuclease